LSGSEVSFDVYLKTLPGTSGDLFLGNCTFVLTYNTANFSNPTFSKVGSGTGFVSLVPTDPDGLIPGFNTLSTQSSYFNNTSTSITNGELIISLDGPTPSDQAAFNASVAKIDGTTSSHRLGRFKLTGVSNPNGTFGLMWKGSGAGFITKIFTLGANSPFVSTRVNPSDLTLTDGLDIALPVELIDFQVSKDEERAVLNWSTAAEIGTTQFTIQHSINGQQWANIGKVLATGGPSHGSAYQFIHDQIMIGTNYYRLKAEDEDGSFEYSGIRSLKHTQKSDKPIIKVFPNPAVDRLSLEWDLPANNPVRIEVRTIHGQLIDQFVNRGPRMELNVQNYPAGTYILQLEIGDKWFGRQFIKN